MKGIELMARVFKSREVCALSTQAASNRLKIDSQQVGRLFGDLDTGAFEVRQCREIFGS